MASPSTYVLAPQNPCEYAQAPFAGCCRCRQFLTPRTLNFARFEFRTLIFACFWTPRVRWFSHVFDGSIHANLRMRKWVKYITCESQGTIFRHAKTCENQHWFKRRAGQRPKHAKYRFEKRSTLLHANLRIRFSSMWKHAKINIILRGALGSAQNMRNSVLKKGGIWCMRISGT